MQADGLRFANGGEVSVRVANNHLKSSSVEVESEYSLELTEAGGAAVGTAKAETPTPAPPGAAPTGGRSLLQTVTSFALWTLLPFVVGLVLGTIVGFLLGRRRR